jgi:hypothetical protein
MELINLPDELLVMIFSYLPNYKDQINFGLTCTNFLKILLKASGNVNTKTIVNNYDKYYFDILVNLIADFGFSTKNTKLLDRRLLLNLPPSIIKNHEFNIVNLSSLTMSDPILDLCINRIINKEINFNIEYEFNLNDKNGIKDYYYNNIDVVESTDYHQTNEVYIYNVPWFTTTLCFNDGYLLIDNVEEMKRINEPLVIPDNALIVYSDVDDYDITNNCIDPKVDYEKWLYALKDVCPHLKNIKISKSYLPCDTKNNVTNYKWYNDPVQIQFYKGIIIVILAIIGTIAPTALFIYTIELLRSFILQLHNSF